MGEIVKVESRVSARDWSQFDVVIAIFEKPQKINARFASKLGDWPEVIRKSCEPVLGSGQFKDLKAGEIISFDNSSGKKTIFISDVNPQEMFATLALARQVVTRWKNRGHLKILVDLGHCSADVASRWAHALMSGECAQNFQFPKYGQKDSGKPKKRAFHFLCEEVLCEQVKKNSILGIQWTQSTNFVRKLAMRAGNDLTPKTYVEEIRKIAKDHGLKFSFISQSQLEKRGAGAFLAVVQGSSHRDSGIVHLQYRPQGVKKAKLVLVGKGITYDTGGVNVKAAKYMYGMQGDMAGSAVALAGICLASQQEWNFGVDAYLAIADNVIGPDAFKPSDVISSASGKTIEIVHSDAEGRMVLADTLFFATQGKPDLVMDFATLTGACVSAIGSSYSGLFSNYESNFHQLISAGVNCGERVWPFPLGKEFGKCLESDIADIKQCRPSGGVDHIEAAWFLSQFVPQDVPWLHVDLAASESSGGLAHIDTEITGFGVRFLAAAAAHYFAEIPALK